MTRPISQVYVFGPFHLDPAERLFLRDGNPIALTPKVFETLLALVESNGRLVHKDELMKRLWPDAIVEEANLARNVWTLRKALGDGNGEQAYIETIPKVGYRFVAPVTALDGHAAEPVLAAALAPSARKTSYLPAVLAILVVAGLMSIGLALVWRESRRSEKTDVRALMLTDGSYDDVGAYWTNSGQIYFSRGITNARVETWTMNADGTNPRRANTDIKNLLAGRWSPDGRKVVFAKDDGFQTFYLADADGGHETVLAFVPGNMDWSPDGSRFVYEARTSPDTSAIFMYTLGTGASTSLTSAGASDADPSFSNDGTRIAFTSWRDGNAEIYVMQADGSNVRQVTAHPAFDNFPVFSPDDTQLAFQSNRDDEHVEVFLQNLDDHTPPRRLTRSTSNTGLMPKSWSADGTQLLVYSDSSGKNRIEVMDVEPFPVQLLLADNAADLSFPRVSADGRQLLYEAREADRSLELRLMDLDTRRTTRVFHTEPDYPPYFHLSPAWSPDSSLIAFAARADGNSEVFTIRPDGSGQRNVTRNPLLDSSPAFSADGREIVFARDTYGLAQLYRMDLDGARQRRVTNAPGQEMCPAVSADGLHLAFAGDRESHSLDVFLLDLKRPGEERRLAGRRFHDTLPSFSPDGQRVAFIANSDGNPEIYLLNSDGTGLFRVTHSREEETAPQFSHDGSHILFGSNRTGRFALYQIEVATDRR